MNTLTLGAVQVDVETREVQHPEGARRLTPLELKLLVYLKEAAPRVVPPEELLEKVWGYSPDSRSRAAQMTLTRLRRKIELDPDAPRFLVTVFGQGIQLRGGAPGGAEPARGTAPPVAGFGLPEEDGGLFLGRDRALSQCMAWSEQGRWLTLTGPGGVGKTRLAEAFARGLEQGGRCRDGVVYLPLVALEREEEVFPALLRRMGIEQDLARAPLSEAIRSLQARHLALFLDNAEHLPGLKEPLESLLEACPKLTLVVTSRRALGSILENRLALGGLESPEASLALFHGQLTHFARGREVSPPSDGEILRWLERIAHHALSIRLSAALCAARGGSLQDLEPGLVAPVPGQTSGRHLNLRSVFEDTWRALPDPSRRALARLSLLISPFDEAVAAGALDIGAGSLGDLEQWGLIEGRPGAFTLHPMTRRLAKEKLEGMAGLRAVEAQVQRFFVQRLAGWQPTLLGPREAERLDAIDASNRDLRRALRRPLPEALYEEGARALEAFTVYLHATGQYPEVEALCRRVERQTRGGLLREKAVFLHAQLLERLLEYDRAWALLKQPLPLLAGRASLTRAVLHTHLGRVAEGVREIEAAEAPSDPAPRIAFHLAAATVFAQAERWARSLEHGDEALRRVRALGSDLLLADACHSLGTRLYDMGRNNQAQALLLEGAQALEGRPLSRAHAALAVGVGNTYRQEMDYERALERYVFAREVAEAIGVDALSVYTCLNIGYVYREMGDLDGAEASFREGLARCERLADTRGGFQLSAALGSVYLMRGDFDRAKAQYRRCVEEAQGAQVHEYRLAHCNLAMLGVLTRRYEEAVASAEAALAEEEGVVSSPVRLFATMWSGCARSLQGGASGAVGAREMEATLREAAAVGSPSIKALVLSVVCFALETRDPDLAGEIAASLPAHQSFALTRERFAWEGAERRPVDEVVAQLLGAWGSLFGERS